jgi:antitoxin component HigA of HigAB toxin-antitoxin module
MISEIRTAEHHGEILDRVSALVDVDPIPGSALGKELEVLTVLLKDYERREFQLAPSSVNAS